MTAASMGIIPLRPPGSTPVLAPLLPIMTVVLVAFVVIGLALPVLPLHVHDRLGLGAFMVGLVAGSQFAAALVSRVWAGHYSDRRGARRGVIAGLLTAAGAGVLYLLSLGFVTSPVVSATILLLGRALLGGAESFIITGAVTWGLALVDARSAGKVIAWVGTARHESAPENQRSGHCRKLDRQRNHAGLRFAAAIAADHGRPLPAREIRPLAARDLGSRTARPDICGRRDRLLATGSGRCDLYRQDRQTIPLPGIVVLGKLDADSDALNLSGPVEVAIELAREDGNPLVPGNPRSRKDVP